ncbi:Uncharacterised protein [Klebsiella quasipneumoniae]|nr:Uncharacterised protein [Klebsiella quasipneumoniae]
MNFMCGQAIAHSGEQPCYINSKLLMYPKKKISSRHSLPVLNLADTTIGYPEASSKITLV